MVCGDSCHLITHVKQVRAGAIQIAVLFLAGKRVGSSYNDVAKFVPEWFDEMELARGGKRLRIWIKSQGNEVLWGLDESFLVTQWREWNAAAIISQDNLEQFFQLPQQEEIVQHYWPPELVIANF